jgi:hypothetical protein
LQKYVESIVEIGEPCAANDATSRRRRLQVEAFETIYKF